MTECDRMLTSHSLAFTAECLHLSHNSVACVNDVGRCNAEDGTNLVIFSSEKTMASMIDRNAIAA